MANELIVQAQPGDSDIFTCIKDASKKVAIVSTGVFEDWVNGNVSTYAIDGVETGGGTFYADFPAAIAAGKYKVHAYQGAKDGTADPLGAGEFEWDGTAEVLPAAAIWNEPWAWPGTDPSLFTTIKEWFGWLVARFGCAHEKDDTNKVIKVSKYDGTPISKQTYTEVGDNETVAKAVAPS